MAATDDECRAWPTTPYVGKEPFGNGPKLPREVPAGIPGGPGINPGRLAPEGAAVYKRPLPGTTNPLKKGFIGEKTRSYDRMLIWSYDHTTIGPEIIKAIEAQMIST